VCDGYNVYNTTSGSIAVTALQLAAGTAAVPSLAFVNNPGTGLFLAASTTLGVSANGVNVAIFQNVTNQPGLIVPNGISGGSF